MQQITLCNALETNSNQPLGEYNDGAAERRATLHRKTEGRRLNVEQRKCRKTQLRIVPM